LNLVSYILVKVELLLWRHSNMYYKSMDFKLFRFQQLIGENVVSIIKDMRSILKLHLLGRYGM